MSEFITEISTKEDFYEVVNNETRPVLVDFWATWCGPCRMLAPIVEEYAKEMGDKVRVIKIDVDVNEQVAIDFHIASIPTLLVFKNGEKVDKSVGLVQKKNVAELVEKYL